MCGLFGGLLLGGLVGCGICGCRRGLCDCDRRCDRRDGCSGGC